MMKCFDRRNFRQRWLWGMGLPFVGVVLTWVLWPDLMSWAILDHGDLFGSAFWSSLHWILLSNAPFIGAMIVLASLGAALLTSKHALVLVPLAVLMGCLIGITFFAVGPVRYYYRDDPIRYLLPVLLEAEIGAIIGLGVVKGKPLVQRWFSGVQQHVKAELHAAPPPIFPSSAEASKTRGGKQETIPASSPPAEPTKAQVPLPSQQEEQHSAVPEQDDIARVLAQMQRDYAQAAKPHEPNNGTHQTL